MRVFRSKRMLNCLYFYGIIIKIVSILYKNGNKPRSLYTYIQMKLNKIITNEK